MCSIMLKYMSLASLACSIIAFPLDLVNITEPESKVISRGSYWLTPEQHTLFRQRRAFSKSGKWPRAQIVYWLCETDGCALPDGLSYNQNSNDVVDDYSLSKALPASVRDGVMAAMEHIELNTVVSFKPYELGDTDVVAIGLYGNMCASFVGKINGVQIIDLGRKDRNDPKLLSTSCAAAATIDPFIHELIHAAGLLHEQDRPDTSLWINEKPKDPNDPPELIELIRDGPQFTFWNLPFDFNSVMLYGQDSFNGRTDLGDLRFARQQIESPGDYYSYFKPGWDDRDTPAAFHGLSNLDKVALNFHYHNERENHGSLSSVTNDIQIFKEAAICRVDTGVIRGTRENTDPAFITNCYDQCRMDVNCRYFVWGIDDKGYRTCWLHSRCIVEFLTEGAINDGNAPEGSNGPTLNEPYITNGYRNIYTPKERGVPWGTDGDVPGGDIIFGMGRGKGPGRETTTGGDVVDVISFEGSDQSTP